MGLIPAKSHFSTSFHISCYHCSRISSTFLFMVATVGPLHQLVVCETGQQQTETISFPLPPPISTLYTFLMSLLTIILIYFYKSRNIWLLFFFTFKHNTNENAFRRKHQNNTCCRCEKFLPVLLPNNNCIYWFCVILWQPFFSLCFMEKKYTHKEGKWYSGSLCAHHPAIIVVNSLLILLQLSQFVFCC